MILVIGSRHDPAVTAIVARWQARHNACSLISCEDLSERGWVLDTSKERGTACVAEGQCIAGTRISGILTRRRRINPEELRHVPRKDRAYVASEMNAFLVAWLSQQRCTVLNRPVENSLSGPNWTDEQWVAAAKKLGIPARFGTCARKGNEVVVVGERCFGNHIHYDSALSLARYAGLEFMSAYFDEGHFAGVNLWPDLGDESVSEAVRTHLMGGR